MNENILVKIGADISDLQRSLGRAGKNIDGFGVNAARTFKGMSDDSRKMTDEMKTAFNKQRESMTGFRDDMVKVQHGYFKMAEGSKAYKGTTKEFMRDVAKMGKQHKTVTENMIKNNELMKMSFIQTVGTMLNRSTQASKISDNFDRMKNPLYKVNKAGLAVADSLNKIALKGTPAVLALKMLGPTANMKQLNDMTMLISQGLMRFTGVALIAAVATVALYASLAKAAMGPKPSDVFKQQADALTEYRDAVKSRTSEIMEAWSLFENVQLDKTSGKKLTANLQEQVGILERWRNNLKTIASKVGPVFTRYLSDMGPAAAGEVAKLAAMTGPQLDKYVGLWREKMKLAKDQSVSELEGMRVATTAKIKALQDSLMPLGVSVEAFKGTWAVALGPLIEMFGQIASKVVDVGTKIGDFFAKIAEGNPMLSKVIFGFLALIPLLTLILAPLAIGIGLVGGLTAAFGALWVVIGPIVTGFAAMMGTVLLVAAGIALLAAGVIYAYKNFEWFRTAVDATLAFLKNTFMIAFNFIKEIVMTVMTAIVAFGQSQLLKFQAFWAENGAQITSIVKLYFSIILGIIQVVMGFIKGVFEQVWPIISNVVRVAWEAIKLIISNVTTLILGIIQTTLKLLQGDWKGAWQTIKQTTFTMMGNVLKFLRNIDLVGIGKDIIRGLIKGITSMASGVVDAARSIANAIPTGIKKLLGIHSPSRVLAKLGMYTGMGLAQGLDGEVSTVKRSALTLANAAVAKPTLSYATPSASYGSLSSALSGSVDVSATEQSGLLREIVTAIREGKFIEMDSKLVGKVVGRELNGQISGARRNGRG